MIKANKFHELTFDTADKRTSNLANMIHDMNVLYAQELINSDTYVGLHNILRDNLGTENFLSVIKYADLRKESNEYQIIVAEFPEKSDGTIRKAKYDIEKEEYYLLKAENKKESN